MRMQNVIRLGALGVATAMTSLASTQVTVYFETGAVRAGNPLSPSNPVSFQYPNLGPQVEQTAGAFGGPRSPDGSRLIADGLVTRSANDGGVLQRIQAALPELDADVFLVRVVDAAAFAVTLGNTLTTPVFGNPDAGAPASLFLFTESGQALRGGTARNDWTGTSAPAGVSEARNVTLTLPPGFGEGLYWIGLSRNTSSPNTATENGNAPIDVSVPRNNAGQPLFNEADLLANVGVQFDVVAGLSDYVLSTDRVISWELSGPPSNGYTTTSTALPVSVAINFVGAQYVVVPEPASLGLLGVAGLAMLRRRSR